jgi:hypothetical protein
MLEHPEKKGFWVNVPYRCMLPKGLDDILVGGLALSVHRDALPLVRMQADLQNQGYALGVAAAMAVKAGIPPRDIELYRLQRHLIEIGNLPERVLTDQEVESLPREVVAAAVEGLGKRDSHGIAAILAQPDESLPLLKTAYAQADAGARPTYAKVLAMMGDATGLDVLIAQVRAAPQWDQGWRFRGGGQYGEALSPLDTLIVALGRTRDRRALPAIVEKLDLLSAQSEFSHHRAAALALELIGDPAAVGPLANLLARPGMSGYAHVTLEDALRREVPGGTSAVQSRDESLRELIIARALYRCGDQDQRGEKTLQAYTQDLRGHLARHAQAVLQAKTGGR